MAKHRGDDRGRVLVAAYLKRLRLIRRIEQVELAARVGVHENTIKRVEQTDPAKDVSSNMDLSVACCDALGGDRAHVASLRVAQLPPEYPAKERAGPTGCRGEITLDVAADVGYDIALWHVEQQDAALAKAAKQRGADIAGVGDLLDRVRWAAFQNPEQVLQVCLGVL